jgi:hypothetical protein
MCSASQNEHGVLMNIMCAAYHVSLFLNQMNELCPTCY